MTGDTIDWSSIPGLTDRMVELYVNDRRTYSAIAGTLSQEFQLQLTRCAVSGKLHRMALPETRRPRRPPKPAPDTDPDPDATTKNCQSLSSSATPPSPPRPLPPPPSLPAGDGMALLDLCPNCCRYPVVGDYPPYLFCGKPTFGEQSYCREHFKLSRVLPRKKWS